MMRSSVDVAPDLVPYQALRYGADGVAYPPYDFDHPGGSAIYASAHDLVRFGMFHLNEPLPDQRSILLPSTREEMQSPVSSSKGNFGVGWATRQDKRGYRTVSHNGGMGGVSTSLHLLPTEGLVVAVLANRQHSGVYRLHEEILSALLPDYAEQYRTEQAKPAEEPSVQGDFTASGDLLGDWSGSIHTCTGEIPFTLSFKPDGDVHAQLGTQLKMLLNEVKFTEETLTGKMPGNIGTDDANRRPYHLHLDLKRREGILNGATIALSTQEQGEGGAQGKRTGNAFSHWTELRKQAD